MKYFGLFVMCLFLFFIGCKKKVVEDPNAPPLTLITDPKLMPNFYDDFDRESLMQSVDRSIKYMKTHKVNFRMASNQFTSEEIVNSLLVFKQILENTQSAQEFDSLIKQNFDVYISRGDGDGKVLYTGYFQPIFDGSLVRTEKFKYPLYKRPQDLVKGSPYLTKREIDQEGKLKNRNLEFLYVESYFNAHIIHVQGTAIIRLPDGRKVNIGYAGDNERPYTPVIKEAIKDGYIKENDITLDALEKFFKTHSDLEEKYLSMNDRYIFFKEVIGGPYGSLGIEVTPKRSIATHRFQKAEYLFPPCGIAFIDCNLPMIDGSRLSFNRTNFFAINQDTGSAITGTGRADIYYGTGPKARLYAGYTHTKGKLYYLKLKR